MHRIYAANEEQWRRACEKSRYRNKPLRVDEIEHGVVLPLVRSGPDASLRQDSGLHSGGVATADFGFVAGFLRGSNAFAEQGWFGVNAAYAVPEKELRVVDEEVIFGGVLLRHFGHFILEGMTRFWYLLQRPEDQRRIVFVLAPILGTMEVLYDVFALLGIARERVLVVERPTRFARVTVPEEASHTLAFYTDAYLAPHRRLAEVCGKGEDRKLYLTRSAFQKEYGPFHINEEYFERFHAEKGFRIVSPELLPLKEQIRLVAGADEVASTLSTLSHFALFCRPGTRFTMLLRTNQVMPLQLLVNEASGVDWSIVDVSANFLYANHVYGPSLLGPTVYWQEYVRARYKEEVDAGSLGGSCWDYLYKWSEFYADPKLFQQIRHQDAYDFLDRIYRATHGKTLPFTRTDLNQDNTETSKVHSAQKESAERIRLQAMPSVSQPLPGDAAQIVCEEAKRPVLQADIFVSKEGWRIALQEAEAWQGKNDPNGCIKALRCRFADSPNRRISYRVRDKAGQWGEWATDGQQVGNTRQHTPITGVAFRVDSAPATQYSVRYRIKTTQSAEWSSWATDGDDCATENDLGIAGIQVELVNRTALFQKKLLD